MHPHFLLASLVMLASCSSIEERADTDDVAFTAYPAEVVQREILRLESGARSSPAFPIQRVRYMGKVAYLVTAPCCDRFNYLYDASGQALCAPTGGFAGHGDGRCQGQVQAF